MGYCYGWGYGNYPGFVWIFPILFWGLIIFGVVYLIRNNKRKGDYEVLNILKHEYAIGNISRDEFLTRKKDLEN